MKITENVSFTSGKEIEVVTTNGKTVIEQIREMNGKSPYQWVVMNKGIINLNAIVMCVVKEEQ